MGQETKNLKFEGDEKNVIARQALFGWKVEKKEKVREMTGVNSYTDYVKVSFVRETEGDNGEKLKALETEYAKTEKEIDVLIEQLEVTQKGKPIEPVWKETETRSTALGNGDYWVTETTTYYGGYTPTHWFWGLLLFTPIMPIALIYLIVKGVKKSKCKKKLKEALKEYKVKYAEWSEKCSQLRKEKNALEHRLEEIISEANELK